MTTALPRLHYVEDEIDAAGIVIEMLADDYEIDHARTGEEALRLALGRRYDVMVVDRRLPGIPGAEPLTAVRTAHISTPAIMLTALGTVDDRMSGLDAGADDYLLAVARSAKRRTKTRRRPCRRRVPTPPTEPIPDGPPFLTGLRS